MDAIKAYLDITKRTAPNWAPANWATSLTSDLADRGVAIYHPAEKSRVKLVV